MEWTGLDGGTGPHLGPYVIRPHFPGRRSIVLKGRGLDRLRDLEEVWTQGSLCLGERGVTVSYGWDDVCLLSPSLLRNGDPSGPGGNNRRLENTDPSLLSRGSE